MNDIQPVTINDEPLDKHSLESEPVFFERFKDTISTLFTKELVEEGYFLKRLGALTLGATTQFVDRGRAMIFVLPTVFDQSMQHAFENGYNSYQTAGLSGAAVGGTFAAWSYLVGKSFQVSVNAFPETTKKVQVNHPAMVGTVSRAIGGFPTQEELDAIEPVIPYTGYDVGPYASRTTILGKIATGLSRGAKTGLLYGTTPQVGMAKVRQYSNKSIDRVRNAATLESGAVLGGIATGMTALIVNDFMGAAENIRDVITNKNILMGSSAFFIVWGALGNYRARKKFNKEQPVEQDDERGFTIGKSLFSRPNMEVDRA